GLVQEHKSALQAGKPDLHVRDFGAQQLQRLIHLPNVGHDHQQRADAEQSGTHVLHPDIQGSGGPGGYRHSHQDVVNRLHHGKPDLSGHAFAGMPDEAFMLTAFLTEGLDDADRSQDLLDDRHGRGIQFLDRARAFANEPARGIGKNEQDRRDGQRDQGQRCVNASGYVYHADQHEKRGEQRDDALDGYVLDSGGIVLNSINRIGRAVAVVKSERQALDVIEQVGAEVPNQLLAGVRL